MANLDEDKTHERNSLTTFWVSTCAPALGLLVVLGGILYVTGVFAAVSEEPPIPNFYEIYPANRCAPGEGAPARAAGTLFRGSRPDAEGLDYLSAARSVSTILNLEIPAAEKGEATLISELGLKLTELDDPMVNGMGVNKLPNGAYDHDSMIRAVGDLRRSENFPEYVHCKYGDDRTGLVVALHRVYNECWAPKDAEAEWTRIEGWLRYVFNIPKHEYFHLVTTNPELMEYYKSQLARQ